MTFPHGSESIMSLKRKFDSGIYRFVLREIGTKDDNEINDFVDIIYHIMEDKGFEIGYEYTSKKIQELREEMNKNPTVEINYHWNYRNLEITIKTDEKGEIISPQLVCWEEDESHNRYCYALAMWKKDSEGWEIRFLGSRPFNVLENDNCLDLEKVWKGIKGCQEMLNALFEVQRNV